MMASMHSQLADLYDERAKLTAAFGPLTIDQIVALVDSLRAQVESFYATQDPTRKGDTA